MAYCQVHNRKLKIQLGFEPETERRRTPTPPATTHSRPATRTTSENTVPVEHSIYDISFEEYKASNLNIQQQHDLIGQIRNEVPLIDRDEIDVYLIAEAAKQLELCLFPMCKMMHVDPMAVRRMMDEQFRNAYGLEVEGMIAQDESAAMAHGVDGEADMGADNVSSAGVNAGNYGSSNAKSRKGDTAAVADKSPAGKTTKRATSIKVQKQVKSYKDKLDARQIKCFIATFRSKAAAVKWAEL